MLYTYDVCSTRTHAYITFPIKNEMFQIFDNEVQKLFEDSAPFEVGGGRLLQAKTKLRNILLTLISERGKDKRPIPANYEERDVLGEILRLNLRENVDEKLFWYSGIFRLMDEAIKNNCNLKFLPNDGERHIDHTVDVGIKIT